MVSKCFNPACSTHFTHLAEGTIFRLEPDGSFANTTVEAEYFWLCEAYEAALTLTLQEDGVVDIAPAPRARRTPRASGMAARSDITAVGEFLRMAQGYSLWAPTGNYE